MKTNAELVAPYVDDAKVAARNALKRFRENPDELIIGCTPFILLTLATMRHKLNFAERAIMAECSFWGGTLAVEQYRAWKTKPTSTITFRKAEL